jgi:hypothetical protein
MFELCATESRVLLQFGLVAMLIGLVICFVSTGAWLISYETQHTFGALIHDVMTPANITIEKFADAGGKGNNGFLARVESGAPHFYGADLLPSSLLHTYFILGV